MFLVWAFVFNYWTQQARATESAGLLKAATFLLPKIESLDWLVWNRVTLALLLPLYTKSVKVFFELESHQSLWIEATDSAACCRVNLEYGATCQVRCCLLVQPFHLGTEENWTPSPNPGTKKATSLTSHQTENLCVSGPRKVKKQKYHVVFAKEDQLGWTFLFFLFPWELFFATKNCNLRNEHIFWDVLETHFFCVFILDLITFIYWVFQITTSDANLIGNNPHQVHQFVSLEQIGQRHQYYSWWFRNPKQPPGMLLKHRNYGISTTNLNWWTPDFWTINRTMINW